MKKAILLMVITIAILLSCSKDEKKEPVLSPAKFSISESTFDFGGVKLKEEVSRDFTVSNKGQKELKIISNSFKGDGNSEFTTTITPQSIKGGGSYKFIVRFIPKKEGVKNVILTIKTNDGDKTINLKAEGLKEPVVSVPNARFKKMLLAHGKTIKNTEGITGIGVIDTNGDGEIQVSEAEAYTGTLFLNSEKNTPDNEKISELTGLEAFVNITKLFCSADPKNKGKIKTLDVSNNQKLKFLFCDYNIIENLIVKNNEELEILSCSFNSISQLELPTNLKHLYCNSNKLTSLNVANNTELQTLRAGSNLIKEIDVANNKKLTHLAVESNQLTSIDVSKNTELKKLECQNNEISELNLDSNINLEHLNFSNTKVTSINTSNLAMLTELLCYSTSLANLDVSKNTELKNSTFGLDCSNTPNLTCIQVNQNQLNNIPNNWVKDDNDTYSLDCATATAIVNIPDANFKKALLAHGKTILDGKDGQGGSIKGIEVIDKNNDNEIQVSEAESYTGTIFVNVKTGTSNNEKIKSLKGLEAFINLTKLYCQGEWSNSKYTNGLITELDVTHNTKLKILECGGNKLTSLNLTQNQELTWLTCANNELSNLDISNNTKLESIAIARNNIRTIDVSNNTLLWQIHCPYNLIESLDVSKNINLGTLHCSDNNISQLNLQNNINLWGLICNNNNLGNLDVSRNINLKELICQYNNIKTLDLKQNIELKYLNCRNNKINNIDVSENAKLKTFISTNNQLTCIQVNQNQLNNIPNNWRKDNNASYSLDCSVTPTPPTLANVEVVTTTETSMKLTSAVTNIGTSNVTEYGFCWSTSPNPTTQNNKVSLGSATNPVNFQKVLENLTPNTTYYIKAYAINKTGTAYSQEVQGTTKQQPTPPVLANIEVVGVTETTVKLASGISNIGTSNVTEYGFCWSTSPNPTTQNNKVSLGSATNPINFEKVLENLTPNTTYYIKSYAINSVGTAYSQEVQGTTKQQPTPPVLANIEVVGVTETTVKLASGISNIGTSNVTEYGFCWSTSPNPTTQNNKVSLGSAMDPINFEKVLENLTPNTTYYIKSYAINSVGTAYSQEVQGTTQAPQLTLATVETNMPSSVKSCSAILNGNITDLGNSPITDYGFYYSSTNSIPTEADNRLTLGTTYVAQTFSKQAAGLQKQTTYYVRAYAINEKGISYGAVQQFTTKNESITVRQGLLAYYNFDSQNANNYMGNENYDGILQGKGNAPTYSTDSPNGKGKSVEFSAGKHYHLTTPSDKNATAVTYSVWVKTNDTFNYNSQGPIIYATADAPRFGAYNHLGRLLALSTRVSWWTSAPSYSFNLNITNILKNNQWHHLVITSENSKSYKLYINGRFYESRYTAIAVLGNRENAIIGYKFKGKIDNLRIYNRALSLEEVKEIYSCEKQ